MKKVLSVLGAAVAVAYIVGLFFVAIVFARYWAVGPTTVITDNGSLWGLFLIGLAAGFLLAACAWPPLYQQGLEKGRVEGRMAALPESTDQRAGTTRVSRHRG